jgi:hypothetical protein
MGDGRIFITCLLLVNYFYKIGVGLYSRPHYYFEHSGHRSLIKINLFTPQETASLSICSRVRGLLTHSRYFLNLPQLEQTTKATALGVIITSSFSGYSLPVQLVQVIG